jgi:hypothetical protein
MQDAIKHILVAEHLCASNENQNNYSRYNVSLNARDLKLVWSVLEDGIFMVSALPHLKFSDYTSETADPSGRAV